MTAHSKIGASSMYRWSVCPGSVRLSEGIESKSSVYADAGIKAHEFAANLIDNNGVNDGAFDVDDMEMLEACMVYVDWVLAQVGPSDVLHIERKFDLSSVHPGCFGTADCVIWKPATQHLIVGDFKYGAGIPVEVDNNPQLLFYGLGALLDTKHPAKTVELVIAQPRCNHPAGFIRSQTIDAIDLLDFSVDLKDYALATERPDAPLVPGDHCRFCPAAPTCPALSKRVTEVARVEFGPTLSYDPAALKQALDNREVVKAWLKALDEFAYAEAEAGRCPPGYKLVAKRATRQWKSEGDVIEALQDLGVKPDVMYEPRVLKTPAQLEKAIDKSILADFIVAESSGHTLVPESDKRPAVKPTAREEFATLEGR